MESDDIGWQPVSVVEVDPDLALVVGSTDRLSMFQAGMEGGDFFIIPLLGVPPGQDGEPEPCEQREWMVPGLAGSECLFLDEGGDPLLCLCPPGVYSGPGFQTRRLSTWEASCGGTSRTGSAWGSGSCE